MPEATETEQYLTFMLGEETFGVEVSKVQEILDTKAITKIPQTPYFMCGVINLRGGVVPVIDLRLKFGMTASVRTVNTCIIVVEVDLGGETILLGALADSVQEVFELEENQIEPPPRLGSKGDIGFLKGMGKHNGGFLMLLDVDRVFSASDIEPLQVADHAA